MEGGSDDEEANFVLRSINELVRSGKNKYSDIAILMRINALTRSFEERFMQYALPYKIFGGFKFYDRKEIKDLLAYLKIIGNHNDTEAIVRIINFPKRGIGESAVTQLMNYASVTGRTLFEVIWDIEKNLDLPKALIKKVTPFSTILQCIVNANERRPKISDLA